MRPLELQRQLPRIQILSDVGQPLFELKQSLSDIFLVGQRNVTPHRVRTARNARHLPQGPAAGLKQRRILAVFIHQVAAMGVEISCGKWLIQAQS